MRRSLKSICKNPIAVVPAQAGIQCTLDSKRILKAWVPACAGTTNLCKVSLTLLVLFTVPCTFAADWLKLELPNTEDQYFYDRSKLVVHGSEITYWKKVLFKQPQAVKTKLAYAGLMRERIDCKEHTLRLLSYLYHDAQGAVIEYVAEGEKEGAPIIPETVGDWFEQALCAVAVKETDGGKTPPKMNSNAL